MIKMIAFDADDTLWENEVLYIKIQEQFVDILSPYGNKEEIFDHLLETETKNVPLYGYGIKSFGLSLIETAITTSKQQLPSAKIAEILDMIRYMLTYKLAVYEGVEETLQHLSKQYPLLMITKGDLLDQDLKVERSGLRKYFKGIEIVATKEESTYQEIMQRYQVAPQHFMMVGNSLRSDVLPVIALGGTGVYYENSVSWAHEHEIDPAHQVLTYQSIHHLTEVVALVETLNNQS
ncbi:MAG: HAD family hydrolase [Anaerolineaceae bacterium]|nr:HAD family hydrolase [Anaerolineaceae bacterium]